MFPSGNSPFAGLAKVILVLVAIGALVGLVLARSDLTNFISNSARAKALTMENEQQAERNAIDIEMYRRAQEESLVLQQRQAEQTLLFDAQQSAQNLETTRFISFVLAGAVVIVAICLGIGIIIYAIRAGRNQRTIAKKEMASADMWQNSAWRNRKIGAARLRELDARARHVTSPFFEESIPVDIPIKWDDIHERYYIKR